MFLLGVSDRFETVSISMDRSMARNTEWVGALVRIYECRSASSYIGRLGITLAVTQRMWLIRFCEIKHIQRIFGNSLPDDCPKPSDATGFAVDESVDDGVQTSEQVRCIPKVGSSVSVMIPCPGKSDNFPIITVFLTVLLDLQWT